MRFRLASDPTLSFLTPSWHQLRIWTLWSFLLAALTGLLFRLAMTGWNPLHLNSGFLRHAHSHLMFFGWAAPAPMIYIGHALQQRTNHSQLFIRRSIAAAIILGLCSYPFFLFFGYRPVAIGGTELPLAAMFSGLVMVAWYLFMFAYVKERIHLQTLASFQCFDAALFLLFLGSLSAWGVSLVQALSIDNPFWGKGLTHLFLTTFTEGWVVISVLGIIYSELHLDASVNLRSYHIWPLLIGVPLLFPLGMPMALLSDLLFVVARVVSIFVGGVLAYHLITIMRNRPSDLSITAWSVPLLFLLVKIVMQWGTGLLAADFWMGEHSLNILYLHVMLLGFSTPALLLSYRSSIIYSRWKRQIIETAIGMLLMTLIPLTPFWPSGWFGPWVYPVLCMGAALPLMAMLLIFFGPKS